VFFLCEFSKKKERIEFLKEMKERGELPSFVRVVDTEKCKGREHLKEYFDKIIAKGGEGVMLREPQSLYKAGRSNSLRKFKPFFDTEVKVVENSYPNGFQCVQFVLCVIIVFDLGLE
jgi:DNA ligase-1